MSRRPTRALAKTAEPGRPASQGVKDHRATSHRHGEPGNSEPADTIARPPTGPQARRSPGRQQLRARAGQGTQTRACPRLRRRDGCRHQRRSSIRT
jgi:hypothetical protein